MYSPQTLHHQKMYKLCLQEDLKTYLAKELGTYSKYLNRPIRYVQIEIGSEYDDSGGYYDTLETFTLLDANEGIISCEEDIKDEYLDEDCVPLEDVPDIYEGIQETLYELAYEIKEVGWASSPIDLGEVIV